MIEGQLIILRAVEEDDAIVFHRWFNDPAVTRLTGSNAFPTLSMAQERALLQGLRDDQSRRAFAIELKDGTLIGTCMLRNFDWTARSCEVGITIGEQQHWGKGYGGEALQILQRLVFDGLNLHKLWLSCAAYNERGLRAYRRIGFREDGRLRDDRFVDGRYYDTVVLSILDNEWRAQHANSAEGETRDAAAETPVGEPTANTVKGAAESSEGSSDMIAADTAKGAAEPSEDLSDTIAADTPTRADEESEMTNPPANGFSFTLQKTYYERGFFNVPAESDGQVRSAEGPIELVLDNMEQTVPARLDRKANSNGTARIFGGVKLRAWFRANFGAMDVVQVAVESPDVLRLRRPTA